MQQLRRFNRRILAPATDRGRAQSSSGGEKQAASIWCELGRLGCHHVPSADRLVANAAKRVKGLGSRRELRPVGPCKYTR